MNYNCILCSQKLIKGPKPFAYDEVFKCNNIFHTYVYIINNNIGRISYCPRTFSSKIIEYSYLNKTTSYLESAKIILIVKSIVPITIDPDGTIHLDALIKRLKSLIVFS